MATDVKELAKQPKKNRDRSPVVKGDEDHGSGMGSTVVMKWDNGVGFLKDVRNEMRKVTTPSWPEVRSTTVVVIVTVFVFAAYFYIVDRIIGTGLDAMLHHLSH